MKSNHDILNQIHANASAEYQSRVPMAEAGRSGIEIYNILQDYPTTKNEFINTLTNKVVKSVFYSKVFANPLQMLHRGKLEYGTSIEQLFVEMAEKKGFAERFGATDADSLIGKKEASVLVKYIEKNFAYKYKVSISEAQLRGAFQSTNGLGELVSQLTNSLVSGAYFDEFQDMKKIITALAKGDKLVVDPATGLYVETDLTATDAKAPMKTIAIGDALTAPSKLAEAIRATAGRFRFPSTAYNMAGVNTWASKEDLVFLTTPEMVAKLDVNVLAQAFNVSMAEATVRVIEVDELPSQFVSAIGGAPASKTCYGVLIDRDFLQSYDTVMETRTFENGEKLMTNMFLHKQGIMSACLFANAVAFVQA